MLKKQYLKTKNVCKVTFSLPAAVQGETVYIVGDFNNWDEKAMPMKRQKDGSFTVTLELEKGRDYQFRYLVNGTDWHNDWEADRYVVNPFSGDNSVVVVTDSDDAAPAEAPAPSADAPAAEAKPKAKRATKPKTATTSKTTSSKSKTKSDAS
ncbi:MAG: isoamylase early set domain-containing protein [Anaerolinea sp.]|nr:isoamylase early set domain-containing protein [Anaerolinea sp.]